MNFQLLKDLSENDLAQVELNVAIASTNSAEFNIENVLMHTGKVPAFIAELLTNFSKEITTLKEENNTSNFKRQLDVVLDSINAEGQFTEFYQKIFYLHKILSAIENRDEQIKNTLKLMTFLLLYLNQKQNVYHNAFIRDGDAVKPFENEIKQFKTSQEYKKYEAAIKSLNAKIDENEKSFKKNVLQDIDYLVKIKQETANLRADLDIQETNFAYFKRKFYQGLSGNHELTIIEKLNNNISDTKEKLAEERIAKILPICRKYKRDSQKQLKKAISKLHITSSIQVPTQNLSVPFVVASPVDQLADMSDRRQQYPKMSEHTDITFNKYKNMKNFEERLLATDQLASQKLIAFKKDLDSKQSVLSAANDSKGVKVGKILLCIATFGIAIPFIYLLKPKVRGAKASEEMQKFTLFGDSEKAKTREKVDRRNRLTFN